MNNNSCDVKCKKCTNTLRGEYRDYKNTIKSHCGSPMFKRSCIISEQAMSTNAISKADASEGASKASVALGLPMVTLCPPKMPPWKLPNFVFRLAITPNNRRARRRRNQSPNASKEKAMVDAETAITQSEAPHEYESKSVEAV